MKYYEPLILAFLMSFGISVFLSPFSIFIAHKLKIVDVPKDNRRVHTKAIPRFGGFAIFISLTVTCMTILPADSNMRGALAGITLMFIVGALDDKFEFSAKVKLIGQIVSALVSYAMGVEITVIRNIIGDGYWQFGTAISAIVTIIWIVAITNAVNLIDGLDGLAAGVATIAAFSVAYVAYIHGSYLEATAMLTISGAALGFLPYNFHPAKAFMGDSGSLVLGFALACFSVGGNVKTGTVVAMVVPLLVLALPIIDTLLAIFRRLIKGMPLSMGDKDHIHHKVLRMGLGQVRSVLTLYCISGVMGAAAVLSSRGLRVETIALIGIALLHIFILLTDENNLRISERLVNIAREDDEEDDEVVENDEK